MRVCHAKTGEHSVDEGALRQGDRSGRAIAQNFESEEPTSLAEVRDLKAASKLILESEHGVVAFRDNEAIVDVNDHENEHARNDEEKYAGVVLAAKETDVVH